YTILVIAVLVFAIILIFYKELVALSFDEEHATDSGIHAKRIHFFFIILTAHVIAASIRIVGVLLVSALMTLPFSSAMCLAKCFNQMVVISIVLGEIAVNDGLISGYYFNITPGCTIVVISMFILLIILSLKKI